MYVEIVGQTVSLVFVRQPVKKKENLWIKTLTLCHILLVEEVLSKYVR